MIVPMKKAAVIAQAKDAEGVVKKLSELGVLHVEHQRLPKGESINILRDELALLEKAIDILDKTSLREKTATKKKKTVSDWKSSALHLVDLDDRLKRMEEYSRATQNRIKEWEEWGDFDPDAIKSLEEKNIHVGLYRVPAKNVKDFPKNALVKRVSTKKGTTNCIVISREKINVPFKELILPKAGIAKMRLRLSEDAKVIKAIKEDMAKHLSYLDSFINAKATLEKKLELREALDGMGSSESIMYLTGYIPFDEAENLRDRAEKERWGMFISDPDEEDRVPTLIRNPRWVSIIAPVFKIMELIPGYQELDISLWFLLFLSIFFGMLIGDAGYGAIFFIITAFAQRKWGRKLGKNAIFILFYLFSSSAILWGVLTGTVFGQAWLQQSVKPLLPALRESKNLQTFCFFLGSLHLSIAHFWRAVLKLPSPKALADLGWVSVLWGAFFLAKTLVLGDSFPTFGKWFFIIGPVFVVLFTDPRRNVLKGLGSGLGNLLLNFVNSFTDVVSYIRLFAVGLATVAIADAFNKMAFDIGYNSFITGLMTTFILLLGHALNIVLGPLAVLVHGVRLNVLEFCSHLDIKWSGFSYKPLEEKKV